jgi:protein-disulfide isomerase
MLVPPKKSTDNFRSLLNASFAWVMPWFALFAVVGMIACQTARGDERKAAETVGRPGDCALLEQRLCVMAGDKSQVCTAAKQLAGLMNESSCGSNLQQFGALQEKHTQKRKPCTELTLQVCEKTGADSKSCATVEEQVQSVEASECVKLIRRVDSVIENLQRQELATSPLGVEQQARIAAGEAPSFGPKDAKVTLVQFSDFQCPFCARAAKVTQQVREQYADRVRFVFHNFPLANHSRARPAALAAIAAHSQGKFWGFHDRLFANQSRLEEDDLLQYAKAEGLDLARFKKERQSNELGSELLTEQVLGGSVAVQATPTLFLNGRRIADPSNFELLKTEIDRELAK